MSGKGLSEPALADTGLARQQHDRAAARQRTVDDRQQRGQLPVPADQACRRRRRDGGLEAGVLRQDPLLELAQGATWLDSQLIHEHAPGVSIDAKRVGLTAAAIEREHELGTQPLLQRMLGHQRLELRNHGGVIAKRELGIDAVLDRAQA